MAIRGSLRARLLSRSPSLPPAIFFCWHPHRPCSQDTTRILMYAHQCATTGVCVGDLTAIPGLNHGTIWIRFVAWLLTMGFSPDGLHVVVVIGLSVATAVAFVVLRRDDPRSALTWTGDLPATRGTRLTVSETRRPRIRPANASGGVLRSRQERDESRVAILRSGWGRARAFGQSARDAYGLSLLRCFLHNGAGGSADPAHRSAPGRFRSGRAFPRRLATHARRIPCRCSADRRSGGRRGLLGKPALSPPAGRRSVEPAAPGAGVHTSLHRNHRPRNCRKRFSWIPVFRRRAPARAFATRGQTEHRPAAAMGGCSGCPYATYPDRSSIYRGGPMPR
jgi:hypothetical protein